MQSNDNKLFAAYKRRAFLTPGILTVLAAGMAFAPMAASAQAQTPPAGQNPIPGTVQTTPVPGGAQTPVPGGTQTTPAPGGTQTDTNGKTITITPQPRRTYDPSQGGGQFGGQGGRQFGGRGNRDGGMGAFPAPGGSVSMNFNGSNIVEVLKYFSAITGQTVTADASVSGYVTIISPKQVSVDDAFKILQSVLATRGFIAQSNGSVISVEPFKVAVANSTTTNTDRAIDKVNPRNQVMTQIIPLENVDSDALAKDLQPLITSGASLVGSTSSNSLILTDTGDNVKRFLSIVDLLDKPSANTDMVIYQLKRAEATNVANIINNLYSQTPNTGRGGGFGGGGGNRGAFGVNPNAQMNIPGMTGQGGSGTSKPSVVAIADSRTNSVIVTASRDKQTEISKKLIAVLDDADTNTLDTHMIKVKYADATSLATTLNTVLSNMHGTSSSTSNTGNRGGGGGGFNPFQFLGGGGGNNSSSQQGTSTDPFAQIVADARTNSLLVTASAEKMAMIEAYIKQIDVLVPTETTTFVLKLSAASASDVATALSQAFGTTTTTTNNTQNQTRNGQSTSTSGGSSNGTSRTASNRTFGSAP